MAQFVLAAAQSLAAESVEVAHRLRAGDLAVAMDHLCNLLDSLEPFLIHLRTCREAFAGLSPQMTGACRQYEARLLGMLDRVQSTLDARDWVSLTLTLEHALARALRDYEALARPIARMVDQPALAA